MKNNFEERKKQFEQIAKELTEFFDKKNRDYGDSFFTGRMMAYPIDKELEKIRYYTEIRRKISRIAEFALQRLKGDKASNKIADETEEDTIRDIVIYSIMEILKRRLEENNERSTKI
jgi:hypothetical protein